MEATGFFYANMNDNINNNMNANLNDNKSKTKVKTKNTRKNKENGQKTTGREKRTEEMQQINSKERIKLV